MPISRFTGPRSSLPTFPERKRRKGGGKILPVMLVLFLCLCLPACREAPEASQWSIRVFDVASQSYIWVEATVFNDSWHGSAGNANGGYGPPPIGGRPAILGPLPLPHKVSARWFHFGQQRYYEAVIDDPALPDKIAAIAEEKRVQGEYWLTLIVSMPDNGVLELWLIGSNTEMKGGKFTLSEKDWRYTALLATAQAREAPGDIEYYAKATKRAREEGRIPAKPLPPPPGLILLPKE